MTIESVERQRQHAVENLQVLDAAADPRFDRITALARSVFEVPISTITLIDGDRAWFRSTAGFDVTEVPREATFCDTTIRLGETVQVPDARADPRFAHLPGVEGDPHIRFYAGYPLVDVNGVTVATFCLFDTRVRVLDEHELAVFEQMAQWAQVELTSSTELERAQKVQEGLLPNRRPQVEGYAVAGLCESAQVVGGDYYDLARVDEGLLFTLADVMGKGLGAAIVTATVRAVVRTASRTMATRADGTFSLAEMFDGVRRVLQADLDDTQSFVTLFYGRLDTRRGQLRYVDAGHGLTVVVHADGSYERLVATDLPIGIDAEVTIGERVLDLEPGDTLLCFSDGLFDLFGGTASAFDEIAQIVRVHPEPLDLVEQVRLLATLAAPADDVTAVAVRRHPLERPAR